MRLKQLNILQIIGYFLLPYTMLVLVSDYKKYYTNHKRIKQMTFESYKKNESFPYRPITNVENKLFFLFGLTIGYVFLSIEHLIPNDFILHIACFGIVGIFILFYIHVTRLKHKERIDKIKAIYQVGLEKEIYINKKIEQLEKYIDQVYHVYDSFKQDYLLVAKHKRTDFDSEIIEFMQYQYNDIFNYYQDQSLYLVELLEKNNTRLENVNELNYLNLMNHNQLKEDKRLIEQTNHCRDLLDQFIFNYSQYIDNIKLNVTKGFDLSHEIYNEDFLAYLYRIKAYKSLSDQAMFEVLKNNMMNMKDDLFTHFLEMRQSVLSLTDEDGNSLLHHAVKHKRTDLVNQLIELGIDPSIKNKDGVNALFYAVVSNHKEMKEQLKTKVS